MIKADYFLNSIGTDHKAAVHPYPRSLGLVQEAKLPEIIANSK
eukprot:CAMPEP_0182439972 /NCGR_PEP_ID=MMETSP1167-20130531/86761_1 /TAXON_ID=2988 /ORGANISM="Mallomonas Sp, Strain CCMP3275" /LENGTH=42 /DNA_ID= /DNA_START= /DNA_END= /DNA_ORIENTATION=